MKVFHGSWVKIKTINVALGRPRRDFGRGFYVTKFQEQAAIWANRRGKEKKRAGVVTEFDFDEFIWEDPEMATQRFDGYTAEWLDFVVSNRLNRSRKNVHNFHLVEGPVADDAVTVRVNDYIAGKVSKKDFLDELKFRQNTHQICFCTMASLQALESERNPVLEDIEDIGEFLLGHLVREKNLSPLAAADLFYSSKTFAQLEDAQTELHKQPWEKIYELLVKEAFR